MLRASARIAVVAMLALAAALPPPAGAASSPAPDDAVGELNAWRAAVGVGPVVHDELLSRGCRKHAQYVGLNPTHRLHRETASVAGYTEAGDRAARSSVLAFPRDPGYGISAWEPAPYHRMALLDPRLVATGYWNEFGLTCMNVNAVDFGLRTPALTAYTYPVAGQRDVGTTFWCQEVPNPCDVARRSNARAPTGTNISVQFNGPWLRIDSVLVAAASLASSGRPPVDMTVQSAGTRLRGGIVLIPHRPLRAGRSYVASATGVVSATADDGTPSEHPFALSWDFSTPGVEPAASLKVLVERVTATRVHLRLDLQSTEAREARISLLHKGAALMRVTRQISGPTQRISLPRPNRRVTTVAVLLRGSPTQVGVAARLATDIKAVKAPAGAVVAWG